MLRWRAGIVCGVQTKPCSETQQQRLGVRCSAERSVTRRSPGIRKTHYNSSGISGQLPTTTNSTRMREPSTTQLSHPFTERASDNNLLRSRGLPSICRWMLYERSLRFVNDVIGLPVIDQAVATKHRSIYSRDVKASTSASLFLASASISALWHLVSAS